MLILFSLGFLMMETIMENQNYFFMIATPKTGTYFDDEYENMLFSIIDLQY